MRVQVCRDYLWFVGTERGSSEWNGFVGRGTDAIEAILDALAIARLVFSSMVANGSLLNNSDLLDCEDFPQKVGRAFWLYRGGKSE